MTKNLPLLTVRHAQPTDLQRFTAQEWCDWIKDVELLLDEERHEEAHGHKNVDRVDA